MGVREVSAPKRIQRKRAKGWRMPEGAVYVGRPTIYGNPFRAYKCGCCGSWDVKDDNAVTYVVSHEYARQHGVKVTQREAAREAVRLYAEDLLDWFGGRLRYEPELSCRVADLRGKDLACWCPLDQPCHADVLLEEANR
jgi:hypothetical protein